MKQLQHLNGRYKRHSQQHGTPTLDLNINMEQQENTQEDLRRVQRGFCFLSKNLYREEQLVGYLYLVCDHPFTDDEKSNMCNGANPDKTRKLLIRLMQKGNDSCREFLERLQACHDLNAEFWQSLQTEENAFTDAIILPLETLTYHKVLLVEEIEPSFFSDILLSQFALNVQDHYLMEQMASRGEKVEFLITKIAEKPENLPVFCQALRDTECTKVLQECSRASSYAIQLPNDSESCVRFNYRNFVKRFECCTKQKLLLCCLQQKKFIEENPIPIPEERRLIKAGLRHRKPGCSCLLDFIQHKDLTFLEELMARFEEKSRNGRGIVDIHIDFLIMERLKSFLLDELELLLPISDILLEEGEFSVSDNDTIENFKTRRERSEALYATLVQKQSVSTLKTFLFALREKGLKFILDKISEMSRGQSPRDPVPTNRDSSIEPQVRFVGGSQNLEDIENILAPHLEVILSIPVEEDVVDQAVDTINNDNNLKEEIVKTCSMAVIKAEKGSVVLRLVPLTDDACGKLLDEKGQNVEKMLTVLLKHSTIQKLIKGKVVVKILVSGKKTEGDPSKADSAEVKFTENLSLLEEELEPSLLVSNLQRKGVFTEDQNKTIMDGKSRKEKIRNLLKTLLEEKGEDAYETLISSLKELGKDDIIDKIKPPPNSHQEAEFVRKGLLHNFNHVIDEMESNIFEDTFQLCGLKTNSMEKIEGKSRKDRAFNFLMTVMLSDVYVLAFKKALITRDLGHLIKTQKEGQDMLMEVGNTGQPSKDAIESDYKEGDIIFECQYEVVDLKGDEKMEVDSSSDSEPMDVQFLSGPKEMPWKHEPPPPMKISQKKPVQAPKSIPQVKTTQSKSKQQQQKQQQPQPSKSKTKPAGQEKEKIFGSGKQEKTNDTVVVAIDFGTTYSGFAILKKGQIIPGKWEISSEEALESLKTPTALLLQTGENRKFGFEAEKAFKELTEDGLNENCNFFNKFKMCLHRQKSFNTDFAIEDHLGRPFKALDVFAWSIKFLKEECNVLLTENDLRISDSEIQWILTVPAIWDESAKQFMRKAAELAGIPPEQLKLALEPEAAAIYVTKEAKTVLGKESLQSYAPGTKIMLADLGGGTADFTVMELLEDGKMKQYYRAFGGAWGGNMINQKIWETMTAIFGRDVIHEFKKLTAEYMEMEHQIELRKRNLTDGSTLQLTILPSFAEQCIKSTGKDYRQLIKEYSFSKEIKVRTGKLVFDPTAVEHIFDKTLTNLFSNVKTVFDSPNVSGIKDIILVGGFSQSDIIVNQFKKRFPQYKVIIPLDPELAVLKGAVMFGQDSDIITARISPHTYGFYSMRHFMEGDPESKRDNIDGTDYCKDVFQRLVTIGDLVNVNHWVEKEVFASSAVMRQMFIKFYQTNEENPKFVTDKGCECIGELIVDMPDTSKGKERSVEVSVFFGETEISVKGLDKTTQKLQEAKLNLLIEK